MFDELHFLWVDIDTSHRIAIARQTRGSDTTNITEAKNANSHMFLINNGDRSGCCGQFVWLSTSQPDKLQGSGGESPFQCHLRRSRAIFCGLFRRASKRSLFSPTLVRSVAVCQ